MGTMSINNLTQTTTENYYEHFTEPTPQTDIIIYLTVSVSVTFFGWIAEPQSDR